MRWFRIKGWRGTGALLVALALAVRLTAPTGWMLAPGDHGPRIVICTGHGAETLGGDPAKAPANQPDKSGDHACIGAIATPPPPAPIASPAIASHAVDEPSRIALLDQRPGRGLAAPPPPSQGPPNPTP